MIIIFRGDPIELERGGALSRQSITLEGVTFPLDKPTDASGLSQKLQAKLRVNNHFEVVEQSDEAAPSPSPEAAEPARAARGAGRQAKAE